MQLLPVFLLIFSFISIFHGVCTALDCAINPADPSKFAYTITVDKSGGGNFTTIQKAIDSIPPGNSRWIRVRIGAGVYIEKVIIPVNKQCIALEGKGAEATIIAWNDHASTDTSASFSTRADNFVARRITFQNFYNRPILKQDNNKPALKSKNTTLGPATPALAVSVYGDKSSFHECGFIGFQDTIWDVINRHYFNSCYIEGAVDFIFGFGQSVYENCNINVTSSLLPARDFAGYLTAQGRKSKTDPSGFVFKSCTIEGSGNMYLGRAYGPYSRVIFIDSTLNAAIVPQGWVAWFNAGHEKDFTYAEINCRGPGAQTVKRVPWIKKLSGPDAGQFSRSAFIDKEGWIAKQP